MFQLPSTISVMEEELVEAASAAAKATPKSQKGEACEPSPEPAGGHALLM